MVDGGWSERVDGVGGAGARSERGARSEVEVERKRREEEAGGSYQFLI